MFEMLKRAQVFCDLLGQLEEMDANDNQAPDYKDLLGLLSKLKGQLDEVGDTTQEIARLVGDDIEEIKKKFGL